MEPKHAKEERDAWLITTRCFNTNAYKFLGNSISVIQWEFGDFCEDEQGGCHSSTSGQPLQTRLGPKPIRLFSKSAWRHRVNDLHHKAQYTVRLRWIGDSPQNPVGNPPKSTVEIRVEIYLYSSHFPLTCASYLFNWLRNIA